ncbi:MAG: hypothetical protein QOE81_1812 [Verrucomicrobiota bacterium]
MLECQPYLLASSSKLPGATPITSMNGAIGVLRNYFPWRSSEIREIRQLDCECAPASGQCR